MKNVFLIALTSIGFLVNSQQLLPLHSFYKDQIFANKLDKPLNSGSFFPVNELDYNLIPAINDSTKQYYDFTYVLFQKHLIEVDGKDYSLSIDPILDMSIGKNLSDTVSRRLFQNTKGVRVQARLFENFAFSVSIYENQARFNPYENQYYSAIGEMYPQADSTYLTQNAVVPGGGRTKPFKGDAFDYSASTGYFVFTPVKNVFITAGNNMQFIGDGYRSVLLSDNSFNAPYFRIDWNFHPKFSFSYLRSKHLNLLRRPVSSSVESNYEQKGYSVNYFTYKPTEKLNISLFESGNWNRGDSLSSRLAHPLFYNPVPFASGLILKNRNEVVSLLGLNIGFQVAQNHRLYGQLAMNDFNSAKLAGQIGYRGYDYFSVGDFMLQLEYNYVANETYEADNRRLNNVHFNLPVAHVKGNGFQEFLLRTNYEYKRMYADVLATYYLLSNYSNESLLPVYESLTRNSNQILFTSVELGYRFNRKMNLMIFGNWTYRTETNKSLLGTNSFQVGIRTGFINHYKDF